MPECGGGAVVIISSIGGLKGTDALGAYAISKAADMQIARNLAVEWGPKNVRVNCIAPGLVRTDFAKALWENPDIYAATVKNYPLRRIGEPDEIAGAAVFLASQAGSFTTGQTSLAKDLTCSRSIFRSYCSVNFASINWYRIPRSALSYSSAA